MFLYNKPIFEWKSLKNSNSFSFGYAHNFKQTLIKNLIINFGYNRFRFSENIKYDKSLIYGLIFNTVGLKYIF